MSTSSGDSHDSESPERVMVKILFSLVHAMDWRTFYPSARKMPFGGGGGAAILDFDVLRHPSEESGLIQ